MPRRSASYKQRPSRLGAPVGAGGEAQDAVPAARPALAAPALGGLPRAQREAMYAAGLEALECHRVLHKANLNIVGEVLRTADAFYELTHYPEDDVYDSESHAQYYYHAHRGLEGEHGHFHTFMRHAGMPAGSVPVECPHVEPWPSGDEAIAHLISISMDAYGLPIGLFAPNRWVAGDTWYDAADLMSMLPRFRIDHAYPSWPVNRWISAMMTLYWPHIDLLLAERDRGIAAWRAARPGEDVLEHRDIEILSWMPISIDETMAELSRARSADDAAVQMEDV